MVSSLRPRFSLLGLLFAVTFFALVAAFVGEARRVFQSVRFVQALAYSADGSTLAVAYSDGTIEVWPPDTARRLATVDIPAGFRRPAPWLVTGLDVVLANDEQHQKLARLNRKVLPAVHAGRTVDAADLFDCTQRGWWPRIGYSDHQAAFAAFCQRTYEAWSVMEFLCGHGATDERREQIATWRERSRMPP